jgi:predicted RNase H-like nuclease/ppGpp synthetase/RelA/SpoT-type nucleotidyltranferase
MFFIGVDLAWGERRPTGLAVLDDGGRLVHVSSAGTDDEITVALEPFTHGACLVAIDAPLVVTNPTGNRPAEAALNRDFARFEAGAHPTNLGKPELASGPRGARLAAALDLDLDPASRGPRRAIEVYPHPATVALFRLGRTLKYKNRTGRDLARLRRELLVLVGLVEGLADAEPPLVLDHPAAAGTWGAVRAAAESAERKSELRVVEDRVDAVLCAYIGLFATRRPHDVTTYGDAGSGCIVTPTLPDGLVPTPRPTPARSGPGERPERHDVVGAYAEAHPRLRAATEEYVRLVTSILDEAGINYLTVSGRTKSVASFADKVARTVAGVSVFGDPLREITDTIGVRVITYVHSDVQAVADLLEDQTVVHVDRDMGQETAREGRFGYSSRHLLIGPGAEDEARHPLLEGLRAQVQIRTVLQHAWAEFEHDIRYKGTVPDEHVPDLDRRFTLAAGLLELADREFSTIRERLREVPSDAATESPSAGAREGPRAPSQAEEDGPADPTDPRITPRELAAFLAGQYADAGWSRTDHYAWIAELVLELGITSLTELGAVVRSVDAEALDARMEYRYPPGAVRRLDDALLWTFGERYVRLHANSHRVPALRSRLRKMQDPA